MNPWRSSSTNLARTTLLARVAHAWSRRTRSIGPYDGIARTARIVAVTLVVLALGAAVFVASGVYDVGADDHHSKIVLALIGELQERSIAVRARTIDLPSLEDPSRVVAGAGHYAMHCAGCHLAPGMTKSDIRRGLYPHPPNLAQEDLRDFQKAFWTIKHGIKMSAMPAWEGTLDDTAIWDVVAFVRQMPTMTAETYQQLSLKLPE